MQIILITGTLSANDIPENVAVVVDDKKTEMAETERGIWALTLPYQQDREFHLALILDFPAIGRKQYEQYMTQLLTTGDMSDITFVVKGHTFNAHKIIVSASPVLAAMFQGEKFREGRSNSVQIDDIDSKVFEQLLHFLYTGRAPLWGEDSMTEPLFMAADKYQVEGLKEACTNILIRKDFDSGEYGPLPDRRAPVLGPETGRSFVQVSGGISSRSNLGPSGVERNDDNTFRFVL